MFLCWIKKDVKDFLLDPSLDYRPPPHLSTLITWAAPRRFRMTNSGLQNRLNHLILIHQVSLLKALPSIGLWPELVSSNSFQKGIEGPDLDAIRRAEAAVSQVNKDPAHNTIQLTNRPQPYKLRG